MPIENCLFNVGEWVTDLAAISCLGAGLAALVLTLLPGKRLSGKAESSDPSSFIDPGAGETARYRLAFKDLVTVKNSGLDVTQVSGTVPEPGAGLEGTRAMSASELAITMFDQGILGVGLGEKSLEATKSFSKTKIEKTKVDSKTKIDSKTKFDSKTKIEKKVDTKTKIEPRAKEEKPKPEPKKDAKKEAKPDLKDQKNQKDQKKDPKKDIKKGEEKDLQLHMAVRKITYGSKKTDPYVSKPVIDENTGDETPDPLKPTYFSEDILDAMDRQPASFLNQSKDAEPNPLPAETPNADQSSFPSPAGPAQRVPLPPQPSAHGFPQPPQPPAPGFPMPPQPPAPGFPLPPQPPAPGFPMPPQPPAQGFPQPPQPPAPGFPMPPQPPAPGFPMPPQPPAPGFPMPPQPPTPSQTEAPAEEQPPQPEEIDPSKDPKKVGRSTLIEPRRNLQQDREPPPPEYFK